VLFCFMLFIPCDRWQKDSSSQGHSVGQWNRKSGYKWQKSTWLLPLYFRQVVRLCVCVCVCVWHLLKELLAVMRLTEYVTSVTLCSLQRANYVPTTVHQEARFGRFRGSYYWWRTQFTGWSSETGTCQCTAQLCGKGHGGKDAIR